MSIVSLLILVAIFFLILYLIWLLPAPWRVRQISPILQAWWKIVARRPRYAPRAALPLSGSPDPDRALVPYLSSTPHGTATEDAPGAPTRHI
jgi:hypothetical protein